MERIEAKYLDAKIKELDEISFYLFEDVPKCWQHYLNVKIELMKRESVYDPQEMKNYLRILGEMERKYLMEKYITFYEYHLRLFNAFYEERSKQIKK